MSYKNVLKLNPLSVVIGLAGLSAIPGFANDQNNQFDATLLEEIEILSTGTRLSILAEDSAASIHSVDKLALLQRGGQLSDLLETLNFTSGNHFIANGLDEISFVGVAAVNIGGLGEASTLPLVNGRRQTLSAATTNAGNQAVDLNSLVPRIAIERIDFLKNGASSVYGSDAVAGVMNVLTYRDFTGKEISVDVLDSHSGALDRTFSAMVGDQFDNVSYLVAASYLLRDPVSAADVRDEYELRNSSSIFGQPGTYLNLANGVRTPDPACEEVAQSNPDTTTYTGPNGNCVFNFGDAFQLVNDEERTNLYGQVRIDLASGGNIFFEGGYVNNEIIATTSPTQPVLFPQVVPVTNPGNFAGAPLLQFGRVLGSGSEPTEIDVESTTYRLATGLQLPLSEAWTLNTTLTHSVNEYDYSDPSDTARDRYVLALNGQGGPNGDLFYNPLFGAENDPEVLDFIRGAYAYNAEASLTVLDVYATTKLFALPAGNVELVFGTQLQHNKLEARYSEDARNDNLFFFIGNRDFEGEKDIVAAFAETHIPVLETLNIEAALRYEDQEGFESVDPKVGIVWRAADAWRLYGTYNTSFRSSTLFQDNAIVNTPARVFDPVVDDQVTVSQRTLSDPNDSLEAEESKNFNVGIEWNLANYMLTSKLEYSYFDYTDIITTENATALVAQDPFGDRVTRDSTTNALLAVTTFYRNAGGIETDRLDLSIAYELTSSVTLKSNTTYTLSYDLDDPILGKIDGLGKRNFSNFGSPMPELRSSFGVHWQGSYNSANLVVRHIGSYEDDINDGSGTSNDIDSYTTLDALWRIDLPTAGGFGNAFSVSLGVKNLLDEYGPDIASRQGYDPRTVNGLGRQGWVSLGITF